MAIFTSDPSSLQGPLCYSCKHRRDLPGDTHSSCVNWNATVEGDPTGIKKGWFAHPFNFDPVWLKTCDEFVSDQDTSPATDIDINILFPKKEGIGKRFSYRLDKEKTRWLVHTTEDIDIASCFSEDKAKLVTGVLNAAFP